MKDAYAAHGSCGFDGLPLVRPASDVCHGSAKTPRSCGPKTPRPSEYGRVGLAPRQSESDNNDPYVAVQLDAGTVRILWLEHADCESKAGYEPGACFQRRVCGV